MHDVVTDLHVLQDLRHGEPGGADQPGGREEGEEENSAAAELELALHVDELADVCGVLGAAGAQDLLAQGVELARQRLNIRGGEVCCRVRLAGRLRYMPAFGHYDVEAVVRTPGLGSRDRRGSRVGHGFIADRSSHVAS